MPQTANPYGLYVRRSGGARSHNAGATEYPQPANVAGAFFQGAPAIYVAGGGVGPASATPAAAAQVVGVMQGVRYRAADGTPVWANKLPANAITGGAKDVFVQVCDDPGLVMMVQASATLDLTAVGKVAALKSVTAGNPGTGRSALSLDAATVAASGDFAVRIVGIEDPGAPFPDVYVQWAPGIHTNRAATAGAPGANDAIDPAEQRKIYEDFVRDQVNEARAAAGLPPLPDPDEEEEKKKEPAKPGPVTPAPVPPAPAPAPVKGKG